MYEIYFNVIIMFLDSFLMNLLLKVFLGFKFFKNCNILCFCWMKVDICISS